MYTNVAARGHCIKYCDEAQFFDVYVCVSVLNITRQLYYTTTSRRVCVSVCV